MNAIGSSVAPARSTRLLSEQLGQLRENFLDRRVTLREVIAALEGRAYLLLIVLLALPFSAPVSIPGSSTPLGLAVFVIAVQLAFGRLPWLPRRMLDWRLPAGFFVKLVNGTQRIVAVLERVLHPRGPGFAETPWLRGLHFMMVGLAGLLLAIPAPIPFTNTFPGWSILLFACGLLERDGLFILGGYLMLAATTVFFALLGSAMTEAVRHSWLWLAG